MLFTDVLLLESVVFAMQSFTFTFTSQYTGCKVGSQFYIWNNSSLQVYSLASQKSIPSVGDISLTSTLRELHVLNGKNVQISASQSKLGATSRRCSGKGIHASPWKEQRQFSSSVGHLQTADCMRQEDCKLNETKNIVIKVVSSSTLRCSEK